MQRSTYSGATLTLFFFFATIGGKTNKCSYGGVDVTVHQNGINNWNNMLNCNIIGQLL